MTPRSTPGGLPADGAALRGRRPLYSRRNNRGGAGTGVAVLLVVIILFVLLFGTGWIWGALQWLLGHA